MQILAFGPIVDTTTHDSFKSHSADIKSFFTYSSGYTFLILSSISKMTSLKKLSQFSNIFSFTWKCFFLKWASNIWIPDVIRSKLAYYFLNFSLIKKRKGCFLFFLRNFIIFVCIELIINEKPQDILCELPLNPIIDSSFCTDVFF